MSYLILSFFPTKHCIPISFDATWLTAAIQDLKHELWASEPYSYK